MSPTSALVTPAMICGDSVHYLSVIVTSRQRLTAWRRHDLGGGSTRASSSLEIGQSVTGHEWTRHKDNQLRSRARAWCHCRVSSRLVRTTPLRALALCWQFQSDTGAPERDYPD